MHKDTVISPWRLLTVPAMLLLTAFFVLACSSPQIAPQDRPAQWAQPVKEAGVENLYRVDRKLYRSAQPDAEGFRRLYALGVRYDLNLRQFHDDKVLLDGLNITYKRLPINTSKMTYEQLVDAVAFILKADAPVLVHCLHGSDRTGTVVAGYRIAVQGWSKEAALDEFRHGVYGYHAFWFPNLPDLILSIDEERFRNDVRNAAK